MTPLSPSLDDVIKRVRREAASRPLTGAESLPSPIPLPQLASADNPATPEASQSVSLGMLLLGDGESFVHEAYRTLLGRGVDSDGLANYLAVMGHSGKLAVLAALRLSGEGRQRGVRVSGLTLPMALYGLGRLAEKCGVRFGVGRLLRLMERGYSHRLAPVKLMMHRQEARQRELHARLAANEARLKVLYDVKADHLRLRQELRALGSDTRQLHFELRSRCQQLDQLLDELAGQPAEPQVQQIADAHRHDKIELYYRAFEDANRGSLDDIRAKQSVYLPRFASLRKAGLSAPVLDIGCGRGEWLALLREQGWAVQGVDMNAVMVAACREQGLEASLGDALGFLQRLPDASLSAITGFHIIEHLPFETLYGIFEQARRVLVPGGLVLFETPNPENILVGSHTFYHDFTHRNPVTPTSISFLADYHGLVDISIERYNPYPEDAKVPGHDPLTERVNGHLCGPQDYAIIAYTAGKGEGA